MALHMRNVWRIPAEAQLFVEDTKEDLQDDIAIRLAVSLGIDVEQNDIGAAGHCALHVCEQHGVLDLVVIKELGSPLGGAILRIDCLDVLQQVGEDLDEVRLARAKEAGDPDAHSR